MKNPFKKKSAVEYGESISPGAFVSDVAPPYICCTECGGAFVPSHLKEVRSVTVVVDYKKGRIDYLSSDVPLYCERCLPKSELTVNLQSVRAEAGDLDDTLSLRICDGYFQVIDEETGEDRIIVSMEEYLQNVICDECGDEYVGTGKCPDCAPRVTEAKKAPAPKKTPSRRRR